MHFDRIHHDDTLAGPGDAPLQTLMGQAQTRALDLRRDAERVSLQAVAVWLRYPVINLFDWIIDHFASLQIRPQEAREFPGGYSLTVAEVKQIVKRLASRGADALLQGDTPFSNEEVAKLAGVPATQTAAIGKRLYGSEGHAFRIGRYSLWSLEQAEQILTHALSGAPLPERRKRIAPQGHLRTVAPVSPPALPGPVPVPREELVQIEQALHREQGTSSELTELLGELRPVFEADPTIPLRDLFDTLMDLHEGGRALLLRVLRVARRQGAAR